MKNFFSALLLIAIVGGSAIGAFVLYQRIAGTTAGLPEPTLEERAIEIETRIGEPFLVAWANRDIKQFNSIFRGEYNASFPIFAPWNSVMKMPFELRTRSGDEEESDTSGDLNQILGFLFDPISGLDQMQTEFSVSNVKYHKDDFWGCRVLLSATGFDQEGRGRKFVTVQNVYVVLPPVESEFKPGIQNWEVESERIIESQGPIQEEVFKALQRTPGEDAKFSMDIDDFDDDSDMDIAIIFETGERAVLAFQDGGYENATSRLGLNGNPGSQIQSQPRTSWIDLDRDGKLDVVLGDQVYRNVDGQQFVDATSEYVTSDQGTDIQPIGQLRRSIRN